MPWVATPPFCVVFANLQYLKWTDRLSKGANAPIVQYRRDQRSTKDIALLVLALWIFLADRSMLPRLAFRPPLLTGLFAL